MAVHGVGEYWLFTSIAAAFGYGFVAVGLII
jgi:hypothetical protein